MALRWVRRFWRWLRPEPPHHVDFSFSSATLTQSIDDLSRQYIDPAVETLARELAANLPIPEPLPWHKRAVAAVRLLWRWWFPRKPEPGHLSANDITAKALVILHQKYNFVGSMKGGAKVGDALRVRMPVGYTIHNGARPPD
jgi:hypothetical protein